MAVAGFLVAITLTKFIEIATPEVLSMTISILLQEISQSRLQVLIICARRSFVETRKIHNPTIIWSDAI